VLRMSNRSVVLLILLTGLLLVITGCGRQKAEDMIKDTIGGLIEAENEAISNAAIERRMYGEEDDSVQVMSSEWPKEIPGEYVAFDYGSHIQTVQHRDDGNWTILYTATMAEIENYEKDLAKAGWVNDDNYYDTPSMLSYDLGKRNTSVSIGDPDLDLHFVTIYLDNNDDMQDNKALLEEELEFTTGDASHVVGVKIPDRYPHDFCPLYEPSEVNIAMESEDDEFIGYTIGLLSMDELEKVKGFYVGLNPQETNDMGMLAVYIFEAENGTDYASVTVVENQDEGEKEFLTAVTISVSTSK